MSDPTDTEMLDWVAKSLGEIDETLVGDQIAIEMTWYDHNANERTSVSSFPNTEDDNDLRPGQIREMLKEAMAVYKELEEEDV